MTATNDWADSTDLDELAAQFHQLHAKLHAKLRAIAPEKFGLTLGATGGGAQIPPADAVINSDGSVDLNVRLRFQNPFDINTTGVGTITVLPDGSFAQFLPLLGVGPPGPTPAWADPIYNEVPYNEALPTPAILREMIDPGDPNATPPTPPTWRDTFWIHSGEKGDPGTPVALELLANVLGQPVDASMLVYRVADNFWHVEHVRYRTHAAATTFTDANGNQPNVTMATVAVNAQSWAQKLQPFAAIQINPAADGTTKIQLEAHLGSAGGPIIGLSPAVQTAQPFVATLFPTPAAIDPANQIGANQPGAVVLVAKQLNGGTTSSWSTSAANNGVFQVDGDYVV
jgi:hypothetical protein